MNEFEELRRYKELLDKEIITQEEFEKVKSDLLGLPKSSSTASVKDDKRQVPTADLKSESASVSSASTDSSKDIAQKRFEDEKKIAEEMAKKRAAEEARIAEEIAAKRAAEEKKLAETVAARKRAEEERKFAEEMAKKRAAEEARIAEEIERKRKEEEAKIAEEINQKRAEAEKMLVAEMPKQDDEWVAPETEVQSSFQKHVVETSNSSEINDDSNGKKETVEVKKNGSKKLIIIVAAIVCLGIIAAIALLGGNGGGQENTATTDATEEATSETQTVDVAFKDANVLSFELVNTDNESYEESILTYKVTNNGSKAIDSFSNISFSYLDKDGNEICTDGRYQPCQVQPGKFAYVRSYSDLGENYSKDDISNVEITKYSYVINKVEYSVDLQTETVESYVDDYTEYMDFDKANIISFECNGKGLDSIDCYEVDVNVTNNGSADADEVSYYLVYSNDNGDCLCNDGRFLENVLSAGKSANGTSFCDEEFSKDVSAFDIYSYEYKSLDSNSEYDSIVVNLQTKTAIGYKN